MAATIIGTLPQKQPDIDEVTMDEMGGGEAVLGWMYKASTFTLANIPPPLSPHPVFPSLLLYGASAPRQAGDLRLLKLTYKGIIISNPRVYMVEEAEMNTSSEPVETCPIFYDLTTFTSKVTPQELTGIHAALDTNQLYTDDNAFPPMGAAIAAGGPALAFKTPDGIKLWEKLRRGISTWLRCGTRYSQTYIQNSIPQNYTAVGTIADPVGGSPPNKPAGQNYLYTGLSWRKEGGRVTVTKEYLLSGLQGWDKDIYSLKRAPASSSLFTGGLVSGSVG